MSAEPIMTDLTVPYYEALSRGQLLLQHCNACGASIMYPRYRCPHCFSSDLGWVEASGGGVLHSFTVLRLGSPSGYEDQLPYAVCVVKLDEGAQMLGRLSPAADGTWNSYSCDDRVRFSPADASEIAAHPAAWFAAAGDVHA